MFTLAFSAEMRQHTYTGSLLCVHYALRKLTSIRLSALLDKGHGTCRVHNMLHKPEPEFLDF
jgi:hypothetical protein